MLRQSRLCSAMSSARALIHKEDWTSNSRLQMIVDGQQAQEKMTKAMGREPWFMTNNTYKLPDEGLYVVPITDKLDLETEEE